MAGANFSRMSRSVPHVPDERIPERIPAPPWPAQSPRSPLARLREPCRVLAPATQPRSENASETPGRPAQPPLARRQRPALVRPSLAAAPVRLRRRRLVRPAGDRHHQYLERDQRLPRAPARARRERQARRAAGRRLPDRAAGDVARRAVREAVHHALSQFPGDGGGGAVAQPSARRRRAARRLRQDHAGPGHGRDQHGHSGDLRAGRPDAARQLARRVSRLRLGRVEILDGEARRQHHRGAVERDGGRHRPLVRHLHGDGHGRHHDGDRRGARAEPCRARRRSRPPIPAIPACAASPAAASSTWCGRI